MNRDDIIRMAREAATEDGSVKRTDGKNVVIYAAKTNRFLERFAALVAAVEREKVAKWMVQHSYATGHGDTTEDLLAELDWQIAENWNRAMIKGIETEREACARICDEMHEREDDNCGEAAYEIRERGQA